LWLAPPSERDERAGGRSSSPQANKPNANDIAKKRNAPALVICDESRSSSLGGRGMLKLAKWEAQAASTLLHTGGCIV
jgi:hypothetical protein